MKKSYYDSDNYDYNYLKNIENVDNITIFNKEIVFEIDGEKEKCSFIDINTFRSVIHTRLSRLVLHSKISDEFSFYDLSNGINQFGVLENGNTIKKRCIVSSDNIKYLSIIKEELVTNYGYTYKIIIPKIIKKILN